MKAEDAEEYTQSLGQIVSGSYRQLLLARKMKVHKALGFNDFQAWVNERLGGYVKYGVEQQTDKVLELKAEGHNNSEIADALGVRETTIRRRVNSTNVESDKTDNSKINDLDKGDSTNVEILNPFSVLSDTGKEAEQQEKLETASKRKANEDARKAVLEEPADPEILPGIYVEDFFTGSDRIADESVDLVFTDPPYDDESVDLYRKAAKVAARILKPGGSFVAYSGQKYLPEVYGLINHPALRYWWTFAGVHSGGNQMLQKLGIRCGWKPIIWYVKGTRGDVSCVLADVVTGAREKSHHEWQQAEQEAEHFIEKLTFDDGLVVDFFLGGGTTKVAADRLGRRFIGFEIKPDIAEKAKKRIEETA